MVSPSGVSPTTANKKPKLRVQIPNEGKDKASPAQQNNSQAAQSTDQARQEEQTQPSSSQPPSRSSAAIAEPAPPSALPSQFAQNLPSPSTFYPEFYQQNELPSPLNFSSTPTTANPQGSAFHWPPQPGGRDFKPSPLGKNDTGQKQARARTREEEAAEENEKKKAKK